MRMVSKKLLTLGLTAIMAVSSLTTAFAGNEGAVKLYGQELQQRGSSKDGAEEYVAIIVGTDTVSVDDFSTVDSSKSIQGLLGASYNWYKTKPFNLNEVSDLADLRFMALNNDDSYNEPMQIEKNGFLMTTNKATELYGKIRLMEYGLGGFDENGGDRTATIYACILPSSVSVESLGELSKYVIYANGSTQTAQPTEKTASWASNDKGWWIQNSDGKYLTNDWYQSPTSGLWYYMGADGYMLTNTTTPDGHTVNADGVWVQ